MRTRGQRVHALFRLYRIGSLSVNLAIIDLMYDDHSDVVERLLVKFDIQHPAAFVGNTGNEFESIDVASSQNIDLDCSWHRNPTTTNTPHGRPFFRRWHCSWTIDAKVDFLLLLVVLVDDRQYGFVANMS